MHWAKKGNRVGIQWENTLQMDLARRSIREEQHTELGIRDTAYDECAILRGLSIIFKVF